MFEDIIQMSWKQQRKNEFVLYSSSSVKHARRFLIITPNIYFFGIRNTFLIIKACLSCIYQISLKNQKARVGFCSSFNKGESTNIEKSFSITFWHPTEFLKQTTVLAQGQECAFFYQLFSFTLSTSSDM